MTYVMPTMAVSWPAVAWCCHKAEAECECPPAERALRAYAAGECSVPMTPEQRKACLEEIAQVEGYRPEDHAGDADGDLARAVLSAWVDYCRDQGLI